MNAILINLHNQIVKIKKINPPNLKSHALKNFLKSQMTTLKLSDIKISSIPMKTVSLCPVMENLMIKFQDAGRTKMKTMKQSTLELFVKKVKFLIIIIRTINVPKLKRLLYILIVVKKQ